MTNKTFSTLIGAGVVAAALGVLSQPANAFTINGTSASWDNLTLSSDALVGSDGIAADANNKVNFLDVDGSSQVRWGSAVYGGHYADNFEEVTTEYQVREKNWVPKWKWNRRRQRWIDKGKYQWQTVTKTKTEMVNNQVWVPPTYKNQSGLGYTGVSNLELDVNEVFNLGQLTHFNQTIYLDGRDGVNSEFSLNLDLGDGIGTKNFDFAFSIDETRNNQGKNDNGKACAYQTDKGLGCSDKIAWDFAINEANTFEYEDEQYSLELVGFGSDIAGSSIVNEFISQEGGNNSANLFARLVKVDTTKDIPEPASLLGLAGLGLYFARSRKKQADSAEA